MSRSSESAESTDRAPHAVITHLPALDGVRGLAILLVMIDHLLVANNRTGSQIVNAAVRICGIGWTGVDLFFVLSGFLITGILYDSVATKQYFRNFYARRFLRIFPLYYGFLLLLICLTWPLHLQWHGMQYILLSYTQNLGIFTKDYVGFRPAGFINLNHFWSLAVEEQFYLVWPCMVFLIRDARKLIATAMMLSLGALTLRCVMVAHGAPPLEIYVFTFCRADALMIGGALALALRTDLRPILFRYSATVFAALSAVLACAAVLLGGLDIKGNFVETAGYTLVALAYAGLIGAVVAKPAWGGGIFESRIMRFLGKYSYGIYVFHYSLDAALDLPLRHWIDGHLHLKAAGVILSGLVVAVLAVAVAYASYHLYEEHFLKLKRHFEPAQSRRAVASV